MKKNKIVVTGGSGMVGNSLKLILPEAAYLSSKDYDLTSEKGVVQMYQDLKPSVVIHLAAKVGGIIDNIDKPYTYFTDNVLMNSLLIEHARKSDVKRFIGVLSTCIYPDVVENYPMKEDKLHDGSPTPTNFSYGYAKRCMAVQIDACNNQYGTNYQYLTPCNLYGHFDNYENENKMHFVSALIKKIHLAKINGNDKITLFGTGNPLRQFMHSDDFANVIKKCIDDNIYENFNVATEENISINEIAKIALRACEATHLKIEYDSSKPDGQFRKDVNVDLLKKIIPDFKPIDLYSGIKNTYDYILTNNIFDINLNLKNE